jgi:hypothetical protein
VVSLLPESRPIGEASEKPHRKGWRLVVAAALVIIALVVGWTLFTRSGASSGDPGGHVLAQLTPVVSALPPGSTVMYEAKEEPFQDSCDGIPSSRGWSQVVVSGGFRWAGNPQDLARALDRSLASIGWRRGAPVGISVSQPEFAWSRRLTNGTNASLTVLRSVDGKDWQLDAVAPPVGKRTGGIC